MLVAAAVLPHPPLLVPEVAAGAASELDGLRSACRKALDAVLAASPTRLVLVVGGHRRQTFGPGSRGTLTGFGVPVDVVVPGAPPSGEAALPPAATVGCWMLSNLTTADPVVVEVIPSDMTPDAAAAFGSALAASDDRVAIIAMGDGSASLSPKAPGYVVPGAADWQTHVEHMIATADVPGIGALDPEDAERFNAGGRPAWQVLAGASAGRTWAGSLLASEAPYGVGYLVAVWEPVS